MAITIFNTQIGSYSILTGPNTRTVSFNAGNGTDRALVVFIRADRAVPVGNFSCTYGGVTMNNGPQNTADYSNNLQTFWLLGDGSVASGTNNIAVSHTASCALYVCAVCLNGVGSLRDSTIYAQNGSAQTLVQSVTSVTGDKTLWWVFSYIGSTKTYTGVAPTTIIAQDLSRACLSWRDADDTSTTMSVHHDYGSSRTWGGHIMALTPSGGGGPSGVPKANKMLLGVG